MASESTVSRREHAELAFDACLITAGIMAVLMALGAGAVALAGVSQIPTWVQVFSALSIPVASIAGPALTWWLHGRRFSAIAVVGAVLGAGAAGVLLASGAVLSAPLGWIVSPISTSEFAGPIALLAIVALGFLGVMVWLLVDAARDAMPERRAHRPLDLARLLSALAVVVLGVGSTLTMVATPASEMGEAIIFAVVFGIAGGLMVAGADAMTTFMARDKSDSRGTAPA